MIKSQKTINKITLDSKEIREAIKDYVNKRTSFVFVDNDVELHVMENGEAVAHLSHIAYLEGPMGKAGNIGFYSEDSINEDDQIDNDSFLGENEVYTHSEVDEDYIRIMNNIKDLVSKFLYYDRKEDGYLPLGLIESKIKNGEISIDNMVEEFRNSLEKTYNKDERNC